METRTSESSSAGVADEASGLLAGAGVLTIALFPFAVPGLLLGLALALPLVVLALPALAIWLLVRSVSRVVRLLRRTPKRQEAAGAPSQVTVGTPTS
jgi:uncharacterized membrane protein